MTQALRGIHHSAYRCRDGEQTRAFYEDILGLPLVGYVEAEKEPGSARPNPFVHLFFALGDGNFIAFFDAPETATAEAFAPVHGFERHIAFEAADDAALQEWQARLAAAEVPCFGPIDHEFCRSIYFMDPNGLPLEITVRDARHDAIMAEEVADARTRLAAWTARTTARKAALA